YYLYPGGTAHVQVRVVDIQCMQDQWHITIHLYQFGIGIGPEELCFGDITVLNDIGNLCPGSFLDDIIRGEYFIVTVIPVDTLIRNRPVAGTYFIGGLIYSIVGTIVNP